MRTPKVMHTLESVAHAPKTPLRLESDVSAELVLE